MKTSRLITLAGLSLCAFTTPLLAQLNIPSDGSDGALIVTSNTVIDLSLAPTRPWNSNNAANAGKGVYDSNKWAVVFKYSSVTISTGATVTFANHPSRAPVVWLVSGDVVINGTLNLDGQSGFGYNPGVSHQFHTEPGPGGFRGGASWEAPGVGSSAGFGPGGGGHQGDAGYAGSYGSRGGNGPVGYGNPSLLPLLGGSGGGGDGNSFTDWNVNGGAGGGAILIATPQSLNVAGVIRANGGTGYSSSSRESGGGSGGGIRLVANVLTGNGLVEAKGGAGWQHGGIGRVRIERVTNNGNPQVTPDPSVVPLQSGATPLIWLPNDGPTARIVSIGGTNAPADPRSSFGTFGPDLALPQVSTTPVVVETVNAEDASTVIVRVTPRANGNYTETIATNRVTISSSPLVIRWTANVPVNNGYSAVQVKVVRP